MEILMMVVVEDAVWLPGLPPSTFESDAGMVDDAMIVGVQQHETKGH